MEANDRKNRWADVARTGTPKQIDCARNQMHFPVRDFNSTEESKWVGVRPKKPSSCHDQLLAPSESSRLELESRIAKIECAGRAGAIKSIHSVHFRIHENVMGLCVKPKKYSPFS